MTIVHLLISSALFARLGWAMIHSLWELTAIGATAALVRAAAPRQAARVRYAISCAALLASVAAVAVTLAMLGENPPQRPTIFAANMSLPQHSAVPPAPPRPDELPVAAPMAAPWADSVAAPMKTLPHLAVLAPWLAIFWIAGVLVLSAWNLACWNAVRRIRSSEHEPASEAIVAIVDRLAQKLGISGIVRVLQSTRIDTPMVIGVFKPVILIPLGLISGMTPAAVESILAHELAHIRRHDYLVNLMQTAVETFLFYHPAVWWISRCIRRDREECCDDLAVAVTHDRATLGAALAALAGIRIARLTPAASGGLLASRLRRLLGPTQTNDVRPARWAAAAGAMALCATALLTIVRQAHVRAQVPSAGAATANSATTRPVDALIARGRVLTPQGTPAAGAIVSAVAGASWSDYSVLGQTSAGPDGRFELVIDPSVFADLRDFSTSRVSIVAALNGFGPASSTLGELGGSGTTDLHLAADDVPIEGRLINSQGQPLPGAAVTVFLISEPPAHPDKWDYSGADPEQDGKPYKYVLGWAPGVDRHVITDADGRFRLTGIGRERTVHLNLTGPGLAWTRIQADTEHRPTATRTINGGAVDVTITVYGSNFECAVPPGHAVTGTVRDASTGQPLGGVPIEDYRLATPFTYFDPEGVIRTHSDARGRYRLEGLPIGTGNVIAAIPQDVPYFISEIKLPDTPGVADMPLDIDLHRGVWVTGRVTDLATSKPVNARMSIIPFAANPALAKLPEFHEIVTGPRGTATIDRVPHAGSVKLSTQPDGTFRLVAMPGKSIVTAWVLQQGKYRYGVGELVKEPLLIGQPPHSIDDFGGFNAVKVVEIPENSTGASVDLQVDPGATLQVTATGPDDKVLPSATVLGASWAGQTRGTRELTRTGTFELLALDPAGGQWICLRDAPDHLGRLVQLTAAQIKPGTLTMQLDRTCDVTGRLIKPDGSVLTDGTVYAHAAFEFDGKVDGNGRFKIEVPTGCECYISDVYVEDKTTHYNTIYDAKDARRFTPTPGGSIDLGDVQLTPD